MVIPSLSFCALCWAESAGGAPRFSDPFLFFCAPRWAESDRGTASLESPRCLSVWSLLGSRRRTGRLSGA
eukprot:286107-Chlamydomonas_euryale.AAC.1